MAAIQTTSIEETVEFYRERVGVDAEMIAENLPYMTKPAASDARRAAELGVVYGTPAEVAAGYIAAIEQYIADPESDLSERRIENLRRVAARVAAAVK